MKNLRSVLLCVLVCVALIPGVHADSITAYSLASDTDIQGRAAGATFEGTTWLQRSGSPALTVSVNGALKAIRVTGRTRDWDCMDLKNLATLPGGYDYVIKVTGRTVAGAKMKLSQPVGPWGTHTSQVVGADGVFSLEKA